jgi:hypothetical protein
MEWLILICLVPAIVVPLVLLGGFAGCSVIYNPDNIPPPAPPDAPVITVARGSGVTTIELAWSNPNTSAVTFRIERTRQGDSTPQQFDAASSPFDDNMGLDEATTYVYRVRAARTSDGALSEFSTPASASTFGAAFAAALATDQAGLAGFCIVQRIEPARLIRGGTRVSITVRGSTGGDLQLSRITVSQPAAVGDPAVSGDPYDANADLVEVASSVVVSANVAVTLPTIDYALDRTRPLLVAFDIGVPGNVRYLNPVPSGDATMYFRPATSEAAVRDRQPPRANPGATPYAVSASIYLVERIDVGS